MAMRKTPSDYTTYQAALIFSRANRKLNDFLSTQLAQFEISVPEWGYLGVLHDTQAVKVQTAAALLGVEPPFATRLGNRLVDKGLVSFSLDPTDGRVRLISITNKGDALITSVESTLRPDMKVYLESINQTNMETFLSVMAQLSELPASRP